MLHVEINIGRCLYSCLARCALHEIPNEFTKWNQATDTPAVALFSLVGSFCLYIIDSQRLLLLSNRLLRQIFFFQRDGSRWSDEIRVTFGWPLLDKDSVHQLSSLIIRCLYAKGLFVSFVGFSVEHHAFKLDFRNQESALMKHHHAQKTIPIFNILFSF